MWTGTYLIKGPGHTNSQTAKHPVQYRDTNSMRMRTAHWAQQVARTLKTTVCLSHFSVHVPVEYFIYSCARTYTVESVIGEPTQPYSGPKVWWYLPTWIISYRDKANASNDMYVCTSRGGRWSLTSLGLWGLLLDQPPQQYILYVGYSYIHHHRYTWLNNWDTLNKAMHYNTTNWDGSLSLLFKEKVSCPRWNSNPHNCFSRPVLCPLSYRGSSVVVGRIRQYEARQVRISNHLMNRGNSLCS